MGRYLILAGVVLIVIGVLVNLSGRLPFSLGRLPGDIVWQGKNSTFYFPLVTCLLISVILSLLSWILGRR